MYSFVSFPCNIREAMLHVSENEREEKGQKKNFELNKGRARTSNNKES